MTVWVGCLQEQKTAALQTSLNLKKLLSGNKRLTPLEPIYTKLDDQIKCSPLPINYYKRKTGKERIAIC